ncbi:PREDICTED: protein zds1-like [Ipomoea nil]|uniref:protein zds1-like n=1 Tax=Ipomoea nil TaxID=35883 RepID=UPI000900BEC3|nr:PREDICTED: protein zds1-like [Ipomoea nil]
MADAVCNIIIKLGRKIHSPETATKHVKTLLQLAMKKKLKLDPLLRDEIMVTVLSDYPEFYADWSYDDTSELLLLASEASDEISPVSIPEPSDGNRSGAFLHYFAQRALESEEISRRRAAAQPLYLQAAEDETRHRLEILRNRSNTSDSPFEISPDKPDDLASDAIPSAVPTVSDNVVVLISVKFSVSDDPSCIPSTKPEPLKEVVDVVSDEKDKPSEQSNNLSLVVYSADQVALPPSEIAASPKELCPSENPTGLPTEIETADPSRSQVEGVVQKEPYRVIHPSESSSEDDKILVEVYGSQAPVSKPPTVHSMSPSPSAHSPSKETRKSKRKSIPMKVVVESGDDNLDVVQPKKKRKSDESVHTESNPPVQQVFKTLRSSVKQKALAVVPTSSTRKGKPITRSRGRSVTPEVQPTDANPDTSIYRPQFVSSAAQGKWSTMIRRDLIVQRSVDEH